MAVPPGDVGTPIGIPVGNPGTEAYKTHVCFLHCALGAGKVKVSHDPE